MATTAPHVSKLIEFLSEKSQNPSLTIIDSILSHLGIADVYSLHATCRSLRWLVDYMTSSSLLDINKQLTPFAKDPVQFRYELGKHDALIAGDFVRNFFEFGRWDDDSLLIYIEQGSKCEGFTKYLCDIEGYHAESGQGYQNFYRENSRGRYISVMSAAYPPVVEILNKSLTTAGANFISWNKAYSLFPIPTIKLHKLYPLKQLDNTFGRLLRRYATRGWTTRDICWPDQTRVGLPRNGYRRVSDSSTLIVKLRDCPRRDFTPDQVLENAIFSVKGQGYWPSDEDINLPLSINIKPVKSIALRYTHTNGVSGGDCQSWEEFLNERLQRWIYVEMIRMEPERRPPGFYILVPGQYHVNVPHTYKPPNTWDYADDQITLWFKEWERKRLG